LINILWNFAVYRNKISYVNELKTRLIDDGRSLTSWSLTPLSASGVVV